MDSLTFLLSLVTRPLNILAKPAKDATPAAPAEGTASEQAVSATPIEPDAPSAATASGSEPVAKSGDGSDSSPEEPTFEMQLRNSPPEIPEAALKLVVNILDAKEVTSKIFQHTLSLIQHLSHLEGTRDIISSQLSRRAQALAEELHPDMQLLKAALTSNTAVSSSLIARFSPASSLQAKLLRVLKTIDYIHAGKDKARSKPEDEEAEAQISAIYASFNFGTLWEDLSVCLNSIADKADQTHIGTVLLPLIESLMVLFKYVARSAALRQQGSAAKPASTEEELFFSFTRQHRTLLNSMVRQNPSLMSGSFAILVHNPAVLEFENKRNYFNQQVHRRSTRDHYGTVPVNVRRQHVFEDSFQALNPSRRSPDQLKYGKLSVRFYDEEGVDAGGVTREWYSILARSIFNPGYALFQPSSSDQLVYQPNPQSYVNHDHLPYFNFVGRVIGKSVFDGRLLEAYFTKAFYKHLLGVPVNLADLESVDPDNYRSLCWMIDNPIEGILDLTFSVEADEFGVTKIIDLKPGGRDIAVTDANKREYVDLITKHRLTDSIKEQIQAFVSGFTSIIPKELVSIFNASELQLLISGMPDIDVDEWRANTDLQGYSSSASPVVWFWRAVRSFSQEERAKLLQFVTGSSRVPLEGFGALQGVSGNTRFTITAAHTTDVLPSAHSCFNQLDLPNYSTYEDLRRCLVFAVENTEGFGFA